MYSNLILIFIIGAITRGVQKRKAENSASIALFESLGFYRECYAPKLDSFVYVIDAKFP